MDRTLFLQETKPFRKALSRSEYKTNYDIKDFNQWLDGKITIEECFSRFKHRNGIKDAKNVQMFQEYLYWLGYRKC